MGLVAAGVSAGATLQLWRRNLRVVTSSPCGGSFLLRVYVGHGWGLILPCLVLALTGRSYPSRGKEVPEWGHLTRGGWNVATWSADPGLIRAEKDTGKEQADTARQWMRTRTHAPRMLPTRSSRLLCPQARMPPSFPPGSPHPGHFQCPQSLTWRGEVPGLGSVPEFACP